MLNTFDFSLLILIASKVLNKNSIIHNFFENGLSSTGRIINSANQTLEMRELFSSYPFQAF
jgi:hypothetical protein